MKGEKSHFENETTAAVMASANAKVEATHLRKIRHKKGDVTFMAERDSWNTLFCKWIVLIRLRLRSSG